MFFERLLNLFSLLFLLDKQTSLSFPLDSFVYEANPIQKLTFQYTNSTEPLKFKLQTVSFSVFEQLPGLYSDEDTGPNSNHKTKFINVKSEHDLKLQEIENKYKALSRFTVSYDTLEEKSNTLPDKTNKEPLGIIHKTAINKAAEIIKNPEFELNNDTSYGMTNMERIPSTSKNDLLLLITTDTNLSTDTVENSTEMGQNFRDSITEINLVATAKLPDYTTELVTTEDNDVTSTVTSTSTENWTFQGIDSATELNPKDAYEESTGDIIADNTKKSALDTTPTTKIKLLTESF